jgi:transposase InsO family protein
MAKSKVDTYLRDVYFDVSHPASFGGVQKLYQYSKKNGQNISYNDIIKWLRKQDVYVSHKPVKRKFKRLRVVAPSKYYQFDGDTVSMLTYRESNKQFTHALVLIDILTRYAWTCPLRNLTGNEMVKAFVKVIKPFPQKLRTDSGSEFKNSKVERFLKKHNIDHFFALNSYMNQCLMSSKQNCRWMELILGPLVHR